ncbi:MAG: hypothetical protein ACRDZY_09890 [Acidimicrobiales bacterium]
MATEELLSFVCPRCAVAVEARLYGPCAACRQQLVSAFTGEGRQIETERFEPKMHVTPNHVASKE